MGQLLVTISGVLQVFAWAILFFVGLVIYFAPSGIALRRWHQHGLLVFILNLLLGWTIVGWLAALLWSLVKTDKPVPSRR